MNMTEQEIHFIEDKLVAITEASDFSEALSCIPCVFYGERITQKTIKSELVGYQITYDYIWQDTYNDKNELGGVSLTDIKLSIQDLKDLNKED